MPIQLAKANDESSNVFESDLYIFQTQECSDTLEALMRTFNDKVDNVEQEWVVNIKLDFAANDNLSTPSSPLTTGDNMDTHSILSVSQLGDQFNTVQIVQLDQDLSMV
jgi:hypothetical protein